MTVVVAPASVGRTGAVLASVSMLSTRVSSLICAGCYRKDGLFCWSGSLGLVSSVITLQSNAIAHRAFAGRSQALPPPGSGSDSCGRCCR
jgi:hypothetical protein